MAIYSHLRLGERIETTQPNQLAAVVERAKVGDVDWIRVQVGSSRTDYRAIFGWVPRVADVTQGGHPVHIDPVYEPAPLVCPAETPTVTSVAAMLPAQALECYGGKTVKFSPVQVQLMYALNGEGEIYFTGQPPWLAFDAGYWVFDAVGGSLTTSMGLHVEPASGLLPADEWLEVEGRFDHPAAASCQRTSDLALFSIANRDEAILWCREQFVLSAARVLPEAERPPRPAPPPMPGPPLSRTIAVRTHEITGPLVPRFFASGVWTGQEVIVWGGADPPGDRLLSDGAAYDPATDRWRVIADGPLTEREAHLAAWTGSEMLIWGGRRRNYIEPPDGAAYDPRTDTWREIADGPLEWVGNAASVWTGTEWIIAATDGVAGRTRFTAYDLASDSWRTLPSIDAPAGRPQTSLTWTGDQLVLRAGEGSLHRLRKDAPEWIGLPPASDFRVNAPIEWTGSQILGIASEPLGADPTQRRHFMVAWDPASNTWLPIPQPPRPYGGTLIWADDRAIVLESDLVYDIGSNAWWEVPMPDFEADYGNIVLWAGDRLFVWGGGVGHGTTPNEAGSVSIPDW